jgi:predicted NBD/HSP70 family sugar kinase
MKNTTAARVGIEICTAGLRAASVDPDGRLGVTQTVETLSASETADKLNALIASLKDGVGGFDRIGIAVPGLVNPQTGKVAFSAHMPEHTTLDLVSYLKESTGVSAVV